MCPGIERARAKALTDPLASRATVEVALSLTVPADHIDSGGEVPGRRDGRAVVASALDAGSMALGDARLVEVTGLHAGDPVLVSGGWLRRLAGEAGRIAAQPCDRRTGALQERTSRAETAYRPSPKLALFVGSRDRRCRFPGCSVAARFCDLDHVRPWPQGPTAASNLMCLCRRHHRIKQYPGWRVRLAQDGRVG